MVVVPFLRDVSTRVPLVLTAHLSFPSPSRRCCPCCDSCSTRQPGSGSDSGQAAAAPDSCAKPNRSAVPWQEVTRPWEAASFGQSQAPAGAAGPGLPLPPQLGQSTCCPQCHKAWTLPKILPLLPAAQLALISSSLISTGCCPHASVRPARTKMVRDAPVKIPTQGSCSLLPIQSVLLGHKCSHFFFLPPPLQLLLSHARRIHFEANPVGFLG